MNEEQPKKYLYYFSRYGDDLYRCLVVKESEVTYWVKMSELEPTKISKKKMCFGGSSWNKNSVYEETPDLVSKWIISNTKRTYYNKLEQLKKVRNDIEFMRTVIALQIKEDIKEL